VTREKHGAPASTGRGFLKENAMLTAMKVLIEKQVKTWQGTSNGQSKSLKVSACGFGPAPEKAALLNRLQNGGCVLTASSGETAEPEVDWAKEICRNAMQNLSGSSARQAQAETDSQDAKIDRLVRMMMIAIQSGNITLAMMIFSHVETSTANRMTEMLMKKVQGLQDQKRKLTQDIQNQKTDSEGAKKLQTLQNDVSQVNDDIGVLQTFIREVAQNKQASVELANAFLNKEHETTMAVVRSFGR
jgi:hypothetical protein